MKWVFECVRRVISVSNWSRAAILVSILVVGTGFSHTAQAQVPFARHADSNSAGLGFSGRSVRAILVVGDTIYVGGNFTVNQSGVRRSNLAAFDLDGRLRPEFSASPNGMVRALASDGQHLFVGGEFTRLDLKGRLAALDLVTGAVKRDFVVHVEGAVDPESRTYVSALQVVEDQTTNPPARRLVIGGNFSQINSPTNNRSGLAAVTLDRGALDASRFTTGVSEGPVLSMALGASTLYVGGAFTRYGSQRATLVALNFSGSRLSGSFSSQGDAILDLSLSEDGTVLAGAIGGLSNRAMSWVASGSSRGSTRWRARRVLGDVQAVHCLGEHVYFGFHDGMFAEPDPYKLAAMEIQSGAFAADVGTCNPADEYDRDGCWLPVMDDTMWQGFFGIWAIEHFVDPRTGATRLIVGGDFTRIGNVRASRLAFLTRMEPPPAPSDVGETAE